MDTHELRTKVLDMLRDADEETRRPTVSDTVSAWYRGRMATCLDVLRLLPEPPKPCPFCGSRAAEEIDGLTHGWYVMCVQCQAKGPFAETQADALATWNTRKDA